PRPPHGQTASDSPLLQNPRFERALGAGFSGSRAQRIIQDSLRRDPRGGGWRRNVFLAVRLFGGLSHSAKTAPGKAPPSPWGFWRVDGKTGRQVAGGKGVAESESPAKEGKRLARELPDNYPYSLAAEKFEKKKGRSLHPALPDRGCGFFS